MPDQAAFQSDFYFRLIVGKDSASFHEAAGVATELEIEDVREGGENLFQHRLPKAHVHRNLILKRGIMNAEGDVANWCQAVIGGGLTNPITTKDVTLELLSAGGDRKPLKVWTFLEAYPLRWEVAVFQAQDTQVVTEALELSYQRVERS